MLLRLRVQGFKNLRDTEVRFGPLTCFVGPNGVGKSNLFDAIQFLRHLADEEIQKAAEAIRQPSEGGFSPLDLFLDRDPAVEMRLEADMLVPLTVEDYFGQKVDPSASLLTYAVAFRYSTEQHRIVLAFEELKYRKKGEAKQVLGFPHSPKFRDSVVVANRFGKEFISTATEDGQARVQLHQDGGSRGRAVPTGPSPLTILGGTGSKEYPTIVAARREMSSWHSLHLEPSSLRTPDRLGEMKPVDEHGKHIAATLRRLSLELVARSGQPGNGGTEMEVREREDTKQGEAEALESVCAEAANQLARLVDGVRAVRVREDEARQHYVVEVRFRGSDLWMPPRSLSDGTLRYLALVAMQMDSRSSRALCVEEPENGIHPTGVPDLVVLLRDYAVDPQLPVGDDNPLRQVILNTHSPELLKQLSPDEVLFVESASDARGSSARVRAVDHPENWRDSPEPVTIAHLDRWLGGAPRSRSYLPFDSRC